MRWRKGLCRPWLHPAFLGSEVFRSVTRDASPHHDSFAGIERRYEYASIALDPAFVFLAETLNRSQHRVRGGLSKTTTAGGLHGIAGLFQVVDVRQARVSGKEPAQPLAQQAGSHSARRAVAAALLDEELHEGVGDGKHVPPRPEHHHRTAGGEVVEAELAPKFRRSNHAPRGAADLYGLGLRRADAREQIVHRDAEGQLVDPRAAAIAGHAENLGAGAALRAHRGEPPRTVLDNAGDGTVGLDVVDHRRHAEIAPLRREGRPGLGIAGLAFARAE